jgi:DNA-binding HxlR family transcriptional regulator
MYDFGKRDLKNLCSDLLTEETMKLIDEERISGQKVFVLAKVSKKYQSKIILELAEYLSDKKFKELMEIFK